MNGTCKKETHMSAVTRRTFLTAAAGFACMPAAQSALGAIPASGEVDIAIVGAGAAGIAAARRVAAAGRRFVVLEAADRIGGRCITDTQTFGVPFDLGAHWIYTPENNPLYKLGGAAGLTLDRAPGDQHVRIGRRYAREGELEDYLAGYVRAQRAIADAARARGDVAAAQVMPKDLGDWRALIEFILGPLHTSHDLARLSVDDLAHAADRETYAFCREGFGALLAALAKSVPVERSTPVTRINWGKSLELETRRGRVRAKAVIVTASTNFLASSALAFNPVLPKRQLDALRLLRLGSFERVALDLSGNPLGLLKDELVFEKAAGPKTAALFANVAGTTISEVNVGGGFARDLATGGDAALIGFAQDWLANLYGSDIRKAVKKAVATRWDKNPWVLGASSAAAPGGAGARRILMEPLGGRIYFAGEAAHETLWGTVNGAWESGERAADAALRRFGLPKSAAPKSRPSRSGAPRRQPFVPHPQPRRNP